MWLFYVAALNDEYGGSLSEWNLLKQADQCAKAAKKTNKQQSVVCIDIKDDELSSKLEKLSNLMVSRRSR